MLPRLVRTLRLQERHLSRNLLLLASDGGLSIVSHLDGNGGATVRVRVMLQRQFDHRHSIGGRGVQKNLLLGVWGEGGGEKGQLERVDL